MQLLLEVLVHHVDHAVAESPEREQQDEEDEGEGDVPAVLELEHPAPRGMRVHSRRTDRPRLCFGSHSYSPLEADAVLRADHDGIRNITGAAGVDHILQVGLDVAPLGHLEALAELQDLLRLDVMTAVHLHTGCIVIAR